jgi:hypothetical protein
MIYRRLMVAPACRVGLVLVAGLALASGCGRDDATTQAIEKAHVELASLAPGGANPPVQAIRDARYKSVITGLTGAGQRGTKAQGAAAALLMAQAQTGLAETPAAAAAALESESLRTCTELRALLGQWLADNGLADASAAYDPGPELAEIGTQVKKREEERVDQQKQKAAVDQQVNSLREQAKQRTDAAKAKRQEAGALRSQVPTQTAVQGEQTLRQAQEIGRAADALEVEAADLDAQAARIAPQGDEIQLQIDRISNQLELLSKAKADVQKRIDAAKGTATDARAEADKVAAAINELQGKLEAKRGELAKAGDEAIGQYRAAVKSADSAKGEARSTALMASGAAQQSLGDMLWGRAQGLTAYAETLEALANAKPPLPQAGAYKTKAEEAHTAAKEALDQATEAYEKANEAYKTGGGTADKERIDRINQRLAKAVSITSGGSKDIRDPDAAKEEPKAEAPAATGAAATAEANSPQAAIQAAMDAQKSGDFAKVSEYLHFADDHDRQVFGQILAVAPKFKRLDDAMKSKFGEGLEGQMGGQGMGGAGIPGLEFKASDLKFTVQGDTATAPLPGGKTLAMRQINGKWLIDASSMGMSGEQLTAAAAMMGPAGKAVDEVTADVQSGKIKTAQEASAVLMQKVMGAAMQNMPKGKK